MALRTPISRVRSRTATSIRSSPQAAQKQRDHTHRAEEVLHPVGHGSERLRLLNGVPDRTSLLVSRIEAVQSCKHAANLALARFVMLNRARHHQELVER